MLSVMGPITAQGKFVVISFFFALFNQWNPVGRNHKKKEGREEDAEVEVATATRFDGVCWPESVWRLS